MNKQEVYLPNGDLERIDNVCTQFEESCKSGAPPRIEDLLDEFQGRARQQALLELLLLDLEYRSPDDLEQAEVDYRRRFKSDWPVVAAAMKKHRAYQSGIPQEKKPAEPTPTELETLRIAEEKVPTKEVFAPVSVPERIRYLNDYELIEEIARGGMGIVYRAKDRRLNRIVAIKMLLPGELASEDQIDRFLREARTAAKLRHPNIVTVYEVGLQDEVHYFAMDYIDGQDLEKFSREHSPSTARAVKYVVEAARAVHYAHSQRVLHRDLKPSNLLIDQDGEIYVTDFGLAKSIAVGETITRTGMVMGTPSYMPPEQAKGDKDKIGVRSDVYGLGAVLFFLLSGHPPFEGDNPFEVITAVLKDPPPALRSLNSNAPKELEMICLKCLEKAPENRYPSAAALANDLERWLGNEPIRAREIGLIGRIRLWLRRNWKIPLYTVLLLICMSLSFIGGRYSRPADQISSYPKTAEKIPPLDESNTSNPQNIPPQTSIPATPKIAPAGDVEITLDLSFNINEQNATAGGLTSDGRSLWVSAQSGREDVILQYSPTGERLNRIPLRAGNIGGGMAFDGQELYVLAYGTSSGGRIQRFDGTSLIEVYRLPRGQGNTFGLTFHNDRFFYAHSPTYFSKSTIHSTDSNFQSPQSKQMNFYVQGLASDGRSLWVSSKDRLYRFHDDLTVAQTFTPPFELHDLAYHDGALWALEKNNNRVHRFTITALQND